MSSCTETSKSSEPTLRAVSTLLASVFVAIAMLRNVSVARTVFREVEMGSAGESMLMGVELRDALSPSGLLSSCTFFSRSPRSCWNAAS